MTPYRSREYLDLASGQPCVRCGHPYTVSAHYSGLLSHKVGKGASQKSADVVSAHYCAVCHYDADNYVGGNDDARAANFLMDCWLTLLRNIDQGLVTLTVNAHPVQRPEQRDRAGRRSKSRCVSSKVLPRRY